MLGTHGEVWCDGIRHHIRTELFASREGGCNAMEDVEDRIAYESGSYIDGVSRSFPSGDCLSPQVI